MHLFIDKSIYFNHNILLLQRLHPCRIKWLSWMYDRIEPIEQQYVFFSKKLVKYRGINFTKFFSRRFFSGFFFLSLEYNITSSVDSLVVLKEKHRYSCQNTRKSCRKKDFFFFLFSHHDFLKKLQKWIGWFRLVVAIGSRTWKSINQTNCKPIIKNGKQ